MKKTICILIPTYNRSCSLTVLLTSLCNQSYTDFDIIISDQSHERNPVNGSFIAVVRVLKYHGRNVTVYNRHPRLGLAEHRNFLLTKSHALYSLFLDDDLILEPWVIKNMVSIITKEQCGFVGQAPIGLSFINDIRPQEQEIELWENRVAPELVKPHTANWQRHKLHNAANVIHVQERMHLSSISPKPYKIAWVGGCVLYNTQKLKNVGGFSFWKDLPKEHAGEDVLAQIRVMKKYGGCGILPSGVYHQELQTTVSNRRINAPEFML